MKLKKDAFFWGCIVLQFFFLALLWLTRPPSLALFDTKETLQVFSRQLSQSALTEAEKQALSTRFAKALEASIQEYSDSHRVILVNPSAITTSLPNVTQDVQKLIAEKMKKDPV